MSIQRRCNSILNVWIVACAIVLCGFLLATTATAASTPIYGPTVITQPGTYYLANSIVNSTEPVAILIQCSNVVLDGKAKTIDGTDQVGSVGIKIYNAAMTLVNVVVKNVICMDWESGVVLSDVKNSVFEKITAKSNTYYGVLVGGSSGNTFDKLTLADNGYDGILLYGSSNLNTISNSLSQNNGWSGVRVKASNGNIIQKSKFLNNLNHGIYLHDGANYNTITQNTITGNLIDGIKLYQDCNFNTITKNTITKQFNGAGLYSFKSDYNTISANTIQDCHNGIYIHTESDNNAISGNTIQNCTIDGIVLRNDANYNVISGNTVKKNLATGLALDGSDKNIIYSNIIRENQVQGAWIAGSSQNNVIFNNYFYNANNTKFVTTSANTWNLTYGNVKSITGGKYSGGNSWGQPNGQGFSQVTPDSDGDGICDSPYSIATNNIDKLPLKYKKK